MVRSTIKTEYDALSCSVVTGERLNEESRNKLKVRNKQGAFGPIHLKAMDSIIKKVLLCVRKSVMCI